MQSWNHDHETYMFACCRQGRLGTSDGLFSTVQLFDLYPSSRYFLMIIIYSFVFVLFYIVIISWVMHVHERALPRSTCSGHFGLKKSDHSSPCGNFCPTQPAPWIAGWVDCLFTNPPFSFESGRGVVWLLFCVWVSIGSQFALTCQPAAFEFLTWSAAHISWSST